MLRRMTGIPIDGPAWPFGENQSVFTSSTIPHTDLNKYHSALSYHCIREAFAAQILYFFHIGGKFNPSDILASFHSWTGHLFKQVIWKGETIKEVYPSLPSPKSLSNQRTTHLPDKEE
jgi:hypothetical protein